MDIISASPFGKFGMTTIRTPFTLAVIIGALLGGVKEATDVIAHFRKF
ncbi:MAG TPA: hypothetical protein VFU29_14745 [Chitinophagaceae bacterium]|nr:hypothetical protein [Chitinophagaceae bacterium]